MAAAMPTVISVAPAIRWMIKTEKIGSMNPQPASKKKSDRTKYFTRRPTLMSMFTRIFMGLIFYVKRKGFVCKGEHDFIPLLYLLCKQSFRKRGTDALVYGAAQGARAEG